MSTVDGTSLTTAATTSLTSATDSASTLGKEDFLNLLVAQLKNQDPLDPVKNEDFIAQLAQFNSLEQMMNLNSNFSSFNSMQSISSASNFIGKLVAWTDSSGNAQSGQVTEVGIQSGTPYLVVGTNTLTIDQITAITTSDIVSSTTTTGS
jgi:flagellar basal-body rod modification protein FlgD